MAILLDKFMKRIGCQNQTELAEKLGMTQGAISTWSSGKRTPRYEECKRLLSMGMTVQELFGIEAQDRGEPSNIDVDFDEKVKESLIRILKK